GGHAGQDVVWPGLLRQAVQHAVRSVPPQPGVDRCPTPVRAPVGVRLACLPVVLTHPDHLSFLVMTRVSAREGWVPTRALTRAGSQITPPLQTPCARHPGWRRTPP